MTQRNQHGLSRTIPPDVRLEVRQACGFGCVVCGASIVEYEHIIPEFRDATEHDPNAIALLCSSCHAKVTRKFWSKEKIASARLNPCCKQAGFSWGAVDIGQQHPAVHFGGVIFRNCTIPVEVKGTAVFQIKQPETGGAPFRLSASFTDVEGNSLFTIIDNEWTAKASAWDTECVGGRVIVRDSENSQRLILRMDPPHGIAVESLDMVVNGYRLIGGVDTLEVVFPRGGRQSFTGCGMDGCRVGLSLG